MKSAWRITSLALAILAVLAAAASLAGGSRETCSFAGTGDIHGSIIANITIPAGNYTIEFNEVDGLGDVILGSNVKPPLKGTSTVETRGECSETRLNYVGATLLLIIPKDAGVGKVNLTLHTRDGTLLGWASINLSTPMTGTAAPIGAYGDVETGGPFQVTVHGGRQVEEGGRTVVEAKVEFKPAEETTLPRGLEFTLSWDPPVVLESARVSASVSYKCSGTITLEEGKIIPGKSLPLQGTLTLRQSGSCPSQSQLPTVAAVMAALSAIVAVAAQRCPQAHM